MSASIEEVNGFSEESYTGQESVLTVIEMNDQIRELQTILRDAWVFGLHFFVDIN